MDEKVLSKKEKADVIVYGKVRKEPRFKQFFSKDGHKYTYAGVENDSAGWNKELQELADLAKQKIGCEQEFDSALVNYYPDGEHVVGKHNDTDAMQGYIASFSFGVTRKFHIYRFVRKGQPDPVYKTYELEDASLFVMKPGMQENFKHALPKMPKIKEGRINVTFRQQQHLKRKPETLEDKTDKKTKN